MATDYTLTFTVELDIVDGTPNTPKFRKNMTHAIYRAIDHALENDIQGAEQLTTLTVGQVSVKGTLL